MTVTLSSIDRFDKEYPARLPTRLQWLEKNLQIERSRMFSLMGVPPQEAQSPDHDWKNTVKRYTPQAQQVEHLLTQYLSFFNYDTRKARDFAIAFCQKITDGAYELSGDIPALAQAKTDSEAEAVLLMAARQEGADLLPALAKLLGTPHSTMKMAN
jgi:hypothetical protein